MKQRYDDVEQLQTCFDGWDIELIQLGPRWLPAWASVVLLPSLQMICMQAGRSLVIRGTASSADDCLLFPLSVGTPMRALGELLDARRLAVAGRGARIDLFVPGDATLCVIAAELIAGAIPRRLQIRAASAERVDALSACVQAVTSAAVSQDRSESYVLESALLREMQLAMEASVAVTSVTGARNLRATAVVQACRFIDSHLGRPMTLAELSTHCGVGARTLEYGFRQFYDTTPISFIKSLRLTRTHNVLAETCVEAATISRIAKSLGFTHMGQYAQDYRALFGESPSMTLQRSPSQGDKPPVADALLGDSVSEQP